MRRNLSRLLPATRRARLVSSEVPRYGQYNIPVVAESVNFQVGQPAASLLPLETVREAAALKLVEDDPLLLQYGNIAGYPAFRESLAGFLSGADGYGVPVSSEELFVTNGVTGGLSLVCTLFTEPGDVVFAEEPSYFLALSIFKDHKLNCTQIPMDEHGLDVDALEKMLESGVIPKFVYTVPTAHNPTGRTLLPERRERLVALSKQYGFYVVADEVYQLLTFPQNKAPPPMFTFEEPNCADPTVISMGSFSKILAPALRLGWIQSSRPILEKIFACGQLDSSGGMNPVISGIVHAAIDSGAQAKNLASVKETLWERCRSLMAALDEHLVPTGCSYEVPDGGYFVLVKLPGGMSANAVLDEGRDNHKVQFLPGANFADSMSDYLRLSFSYYDADELVVGVQRLADCVAAVRESGAGAPAAAAAAAAPAAGAAAAAAAATPSALAKRSFDRDYLEGLAAEHGTPFQLYDEEAIRGNARELIGSFSEAFPGFQQFFAVKALPNPAVLNVLLDEGCGLDCSSAAELHVARQLNVPGEKVIFTSNYTSEADLGAAVAQGAILNLDDASLCASVPGGCPDLVSFRLNPGIGGTSSGTASNILGGPSAKFGVPRAHIVAAYAEAQARGATRFGMHMMTGSCVLDASLRPTLQLTFRANPAHKLNFDSLPPTTLTHRISSFIFFRCVLDASYWSATVEELMDTVAEVSHALSIEFEFINIGGGLGIPYEPEERPIELAAVVGHVRAAVDAKLIEHGLPSEPTLYMECGRYMTGPFGWLVSRCNAVKDTSGAYAPSNDIAEKYYGLDANMSHLMRPGMYGAYHHISVPGRDGAEEAVNVVGTLCENNDWFAAARPLPASAAKGDLFVVHDTGAHSHSMGFQYNCTPRAPELIERSGGVVDVIRTRETASDLFANTIA